MKKYNKKTILNCGFIFIIFIICKLFQYNFLPNNYFYDSNKILHMVETGIRYSDKAYDFTANVFSKINIFNFTTLEEWSYFIGIVFSIIVFVVLIRQNKYHKKQYLFIYASIILLNIFTFNISKDIIQFAFLLIIYIILLRKKISNSTKMILISIVLIYESISFRVYYMILDVLLITIYIVYLLFIKGKKVDNKTIIKIIILTMLLFFVEVYIVGLISNNNYEQILNARSIVNISRDNSMDAKTIINDLLGENTNYLIFVLNYIINTFRLMIPIELLGKGIKYIPFVLYQFYITYLIINCSIRINSKNLLLVAFVISFFMISIIFEPDFGSFVRHESGLLLILLELSNIIYDNKGEIKNEKNSNI